MNTKKVNFFVEFCQVRKNSPMTLARNYKNYLRKWFVKTKKSLETSKLLGNNSLRVSKCRPKVCMRNAKRVGTHNICVIKDCIE